MPEKDTSPLLLFDETLGLEHTNIYVIGDTEDEPRKRMQSFNDCVPCHNREFICFDNIDTVLFVEGFTVFK